VERPLREEIAALDAGASEAEPWPDANTIAAGIRVPSAIGDYLILDVIRQSHGTAPPGTTPRFSTPKPRSDG
jgi:hypothetical protein